ncbi:MAG TPA: hypothetical protein VFE62_21535 [Gemmataceae bacterium]|nr:hypothetical protein [Gemmataceae bacterium]
MLKQRMILAGAMLVLGTALLAPGFEGQAGEKQVDKKQKKKGEPKKIALFSKAGELTEGDDKDTSALTGNSRRKVYKVNLEKDKTYQFDLKSNDFDAFLRLEDSAGKELAYNDDAPGLNTLDSRIVYTAGMTGEFRVVATSFSGKLGKFALMVSEVSSPPTPAGFNAKPIELKLTDGKATYDGELTDKDAMLAGRRYKVFIVAFEEGKTYQITQSGNGNKGIFDSYLFLEDSAGARLAENDDFMSGSLASRVLHKATKTGAYRVICTTLGGTPPFGKFTLEVVEKSGKKK